MQAFARVARIKCETLVVMRRALGAEPPNTLASARSIISVLQELGEFSEAARISREKLEVPRHMLGVGYGAERDPNAECSHLGMGKQRHVFSAEAREAFNVYDRT